MIHTIENIEQALISSIVSNNDIYDYVSNLLKPHYFSYQHNDKIYGIIDNLLKKQFKADYQTVTAQIDTKDQEMISAFHLMMAEASPLDASTAVQYANTIRSIGIKKQLKVSLKSVLHSINVDDPLHTVDALTESLEKHIDAALDTCDANHDFLSLSTLLREYFEKYQNNNLDKPIKTGIKNIDDILQGFHRSDLIILAARPSMGKTALATLIGMNVAQKHTVLFFSIEMSNHQVALRCLALETGLSLRVLRKINQDQQGKVDDLKKIKNAIYGNRVNNLNLYIHDMSDASVYNIRMHAKRMMKKHNELGLIIIDYMQMIPHSDRFESRQVAMGDISRNLKLIAKEFNVPVLALSQLSRASESRANRRPILSDLRDSGTIEQDADIVMTIYRENYHIEQAKPSRKDDLTEEDYNIALEEWQKKLDESADQAEVAIAKNRNGPTGTLAMRFDKESMKFSSQ